MNDRDRIYTGSFSEWGLPDGTVLVSLDRSRVEIVYDGGRARLIDLGTFFERTVMEYRIESLPNGYEFDADGNIRRYRGGKEPLEVGVLYETLAAYLKRNPAAELQPSLASLSDTMQLRGFNVDWTACTPCPFEGHHVVVHGGYCFVRSLDDD